MDRQQSVDLLAGTQHLAGVDIEVGGSPGDRPHDKRLVDHDAGMRPGETPALVTAGEQHSAHARRQTCTHRGHGGTDGLHGVVDRESVAHGAPGAVDVEDDFGLRVLGVERQQPRDDGLGRVVIDLRPEEDLPGLEQGMLDIALAEFLEQSLVLVFFCHALLSLTCFSCGNWNVTGVPESVNRPLAAL